jgi:hypothetical protein
MKNIISNIKTLIASCEEGYDGRWDCSSDEGKEGFLAMITLLEEVKTEVKLLIKK